MTDIVKRLRICGKFDPDQAEAADEIERLREALKFIVEYSDCHEAARDAASKALGEDK